ncbi:NUDIX hydrolase [Leptolyngbya sp. FACHB-261]|uniref:NUDIX hydrolase n=1 Tax=Leptolyngbya sp. FACHB-261 TaxID=2692806 RepID=UPI001683DF83|nr:NUDIX hydrolase [Leptolyngbya sp. FACHB-261]MBD2101307.1 NUDIX hydrolase [Leptolyngbya sp. FACHB-261]
MYHSGQIRALALGFIRDGSRLFVSEGYDPTKQETFYRSLGGGIEFGESSDLALRREFQEELNAELTNIRYLGCLENIFTYDGQTGHELIQLYECEFIDGHFYQQERFEFTEGEHKKTALWIEKDRFKNGELILYPDGILAYL